MKFLFITTIFILAMNKVNCQTQYYNETNNHDMQAIVTTQQVGYFLTGLGASAIIYAAAKTENLKSPAAWYVGGSALITGGICLWIFGNKEPEPKYWKSMQGYDVDKNFENDLLISKMKFALTSVLKNELCNINKSKSQDLIHITNQQ